MHWVMSRGDDGAKSKGSPPRACISVPVSTPPLGCGPKPCNSRPSRRSNNFFFRLGPGVPSPILTAPTPPVTQPVCSLFPPLRSRLVLLSSIPRGLEPYQRDNSRAVTTFGRNSHPAATRHDCCLVLHTHASVIT